MGRGSWFVLLPAGTFQASKRPKSMFARFFAISKRPREPQWDALKSEFRPMFTELGTLGRFDKKRGLNSPQNTRKRRGKGVARDSDLVRFAQMGPGGFTLNCFETKTWNDSNHSRTEL